MATRARRTPSILLFSNSVDEREVYTRALRASGYGVITAATTVMAYEIAITHLRTSSLLMGSVLVR